MKQIEPAAGQRGVVLLVSMLVLLLLGIIATTVARTNLLQLHMAGNDEARIAAMQQALAAADAVLANTANTTLDGGVGYLVCAPRSANSACDERTLALPADAEPATGSLEASVKRLAPLVGRLPIMGEAQASSTVYYRVAKFEVQVMYEARDQGAGRAELAQGVLVRVPFSPQLDGGSP